MTVLDLAPPPALHAACPAFPQAPLPRADPSKPRSLWSWTSEAAHIAALADAYLKWRAVDGLSAVITNADAAKNDFNLSPSRYVSVGEQAEVLPLDEAIVGLREAEEELETANREFEKVLRKLGLAR